MDIVTCHRKIDDARIGPPQGNRIQIFVNFLCEDKFEIEAGISFPDLNFNDMGSINIQADSVAKN